MITENKKIASKFNKFFASIGSKVAGKLRNVASNAREKYENNHTVHDPLDLRPVDHKSIFDIIHLLKPNKATGLDKIPARLIRDAEMELTPSITYLVNKSIKDGKFPAPWKMARVTPLHKGDDTHNVENYRPISILPMLSKIIEKVVHAQLSQHLNHNKFLYHHQYGFRRGHSTVQAVAQLNNWTLQYMDQGKVVGSLFVDISKAFDSLNHKILLGKLDSLGVSSQSLRWFKSYLSERKQSVVINGSVSDPRSIQLGVPQGSILGPLLFNIYINSLPNAINDAKMILYADDAVLLCAASTAAELKESLDIGFTQICTWYCENKLSLNVKKTKLMLSGSKNTLTAFENFEFISDSVVIDRVKSFKYLGVTTDEKWSWKPHIRNLVKKLGHRISVFNRILHMLDQKSRLAYYNGLVLPYLDYADIVWGDQPGLKSEMDQLQGFQNKFAKKVLRKNVSSKEALKTLKWLPLECRRRGHRCELVQNAIKGNIPEHFDNFRSPLNSSHGYNTRNGYLPRLPKVKSDWGRRVTSFQAFNNWMALPMDLRRPMPCNTFKRLLNIFLSNQII